MPRQPCGNFARRMGEPAWVRRFTEANRAGAYLSVVRRGAVQAGDTVTLTHRPDHGVTIAQVAGGLDASAAARLLQAGNSGDVVLAPQVSKAALRAVRTG